jgi:hypothetical protein
MTVDVALGYFGMMASMARIYAIRLAELVVTFRHVLIGRGAEATLPPDEVGPNRHKNMSSCFSATSVLVFSDQIG